MKATKRIRILDSNKNYYSHAIQFRQTQDYYDLHTVKYVFICSPNFVDSEKYIYDELFTE